MTTYTMDNIDESLGFALSKITDRVDRFPTRENFLDERNEFTLGMVTADHEPQRPFARIQDKG